MQYVDDISDRVNFRTEIRENGSNCWVARLILNQKNYSFSPQIAAQIISNIVSHWPNQYQVDTFLTFGGFIQFNWPNNITKQNIGNPIYPRTSVLNLLLGNVDCIIRNNFIALLNTQTLSNYFNYLTVGIDGYDPNSNLHIELVYLIETSNMQIVNRTGKSYPLSSQQRGLIRITNLNSHFYQTKMILGCHDLKVFDNRSLALATNWKANTINQMRNLFQNSNIALVLHHPHFIDTYRTFWNAIITLTNLRPNVSFVSAFRYYNMLTSSSSCRQSLQQVLTKTYHNVNCIDFIMQ